MKSCVLLAVGLAACSEGLPLPAQDLSAPQDLGARDDLGARHSSRVDVYQHREGATGSAYFYRERDVLPTDAGEVYAWASAQIGPCRLNHTVKRPISTSVSLHEAGSVSVTGSRTVSFQERPGTSYQLLDDGGPIWKDGETITFSATGADVPAFSFQLATAGRTRFTAPLAAEWRRSDDLPLDWRARPSPPGSVIEVWLQRETEPQSPQLICSFPLADGHGVVPAAALAQLPAEAFVYGAETVMEASTSIDGWPIAFSAESAVELGARQDGGTSRHRINLF